MNYLNPRFCDDVSVLNVYDGELLGRLGRGKSRGGTLVPSLNLNLNLSQSQSRNRRKRKNRTRKRKREEGERQLEEDVCEWVERGVSSRKREVVSALEL